MTKTWLATRRPAMNRVRGRTQRFTLRPTRQNVRTRKLIFALTALMPAEKSGSATAMVSVQRRARVHERLTSVARGAAVSRGGSGTNGCGSFGGGLTMTTGAGVVGGGCVVV